LKQLCFELASKVGTSGDEREAALYAKAELEKYMDVKIDTLGNVVGSFGNGKQHILLDAHIDQIGLVVRGIDEKGFLLVDRVGGPDERILIGSEVTVHGKEPLFGVICSTPPHLLSADDKKSGVDGISGVSSDFRDLEAAANEGNEKAQLALDMFVYSVRKYLGQYIVAMGGVDAVVFTAGIGENTVIIREAILENTEFLGIELDKEKNAKAIRGAQMDIATEASKVRVLVIPTNEELMIAKETMKLVNN
jgi:hypothetical protein